jgi:peptide chain release factor subunit 1
MGMISYQDIRQLQQLQSGPETLILSLYVNVDQSNAANLNRGFETEVESLFRKMAENHSPSENNKPEFEAECRRALQFLRDYTPRGKALVIFSDSKRGLLWQRDLQVSLQTGARWSAKPWLRPLLEVIEDHDRFGVVLIDKHRARILTVDATGVQQQFEASSDVPNKHATTGTDHIMSQSQMDRDHTNHLKAHARRVAEELASIVDRIKLARLVIGGPVEATSTFTGELPKRIQQMIIGAISAPVDASNERLLSELTDIQQKAEHDDEAKIVDSMITAAMKGDRAVLGIADTLAAIQAGRVYRMVVARDYRTEGKECVSCRVLVADGLERCSFCGGKLEIATDLINRASHRVIEQAGKVQMVSGEAAGKLAGTGIGAVLRF